MRSKTRHGLDAATRFISPAFFLLSLTALLPPLPAADWFDDFADGNMMDGNPVTWSIDPGGFFPGEYIEGPGSFGFVPDDPDVEDEVMVAWVDADNFEVTGSVRTRSRSLPSQPKSLPDRAMSGRCCFSTPRR